MKKTQAPKSTAPKAPKGPNSTARDLAASLRDAITATDRSALENDPEEAFIDLAGRLVRRLHACGLTVLALPTREDQIQANLDAAAARILNILTKWMRAHPECSYDTRKSPSGKFQIVLKTPRGVELFFGDDLHDAYAQMAQTIDFNES
jgi:hypothetical protein